MVILIYCRCGGSIVPCSVGRARVNGRLEMTRSLGDIELKKFGVIGEPEIRTVKVSTIANWYLYTVLLTLYRLVNVAVHRSVAYNTVHNNCKN